MAFLQFELGSVAQSTFLYLWGLVVEEDICCSRTGTGGSMSDAADRHPQPQYDWLRLWLVIPRY